MAEQHLDRGNLLWESSRMFLPEHKEQLLERRRRPDYRPPELTEERLAELSEAVGEAMRTGCALTVTCAGSNGPEQVAGRIVRVDPLAGTLLVEDEEQHVRTLRLDRLLDIQLPDRPD